jgi:6-pyruvoyltetrahydropterin/6-carboxytetrahydropterin synthase
MIIGVAVKFDAAHFLPGYNGKCANMHGHTWHVEVEVSGPVYEADGMVVDLTILKRDVTAVIDKFDHKVLNETFPFGGPLSPTCENLAQWIFDKLSILHPITSVKVREGEGGWARI